MSSSWSNQQWEILNWTFVVVPTVVVLRRFYLRWRYSRLGWDDFFNGLALICLIADNGATQIGIATEDISLGLKLNVAFYLLLWTTLYLVKASFMALYWSIFNVSSKFRKAWWTVAFFTLSTFIPIFILEFWQCGDPADYANPTVCENYSGSYNISILIVDIVLHTCSDILLAALPLVFIRNLHMTTAKKLSVAAVFGLSIVDLTMGILRNLSALLDTLGYDFSVDFVMLSVMETLEPSLAVIICALPAYRFLMRKSSPRRSPGVELRQHAAHFGMAAPSKGKKSARLSETPGIIEEPQTVNIV